MAPLLDEKKIHLHEIAELKDKIKQNKEEVVKLNNEKKLCDNTIVELTDKLQQSQQHVKQLEQSYADTNPQIAQLQKINHNLQVWDCTIISSH